MTFIEDELTEVKKLCEKTICNAKLISCVESMFPLEYPKIPLLLELKSKTLPETLLTKLTNICESEMKKIINKPQIMKILIFIDNFVTENPLCCCYNEINNIKKMLSDKDEFKLRQKSSTITLRMISNQYFLKVKCSVPENYPEKCTSVENVDTNLSPSFQRFMTAQAKEIGRKCVEAPLKKTKIEFKPEPSLEKVISFFIDCIRRFPTEKCQLCGEKCFPDNPDHIIKDESSSRHIERLYCGHILHQTCLLNYMRKPPFGNKKCKQCNQRIFHDKWGVSDRLAEDRWAHEQARERELAEVTDFFQ